MDFLSWLGAVFSAAVRLSIDTTQIVIFVAIVGVELAAIFVPPAHKPAVLAVGERLTTGRMALVALIAVIGTRLFLAPYWVWENEHQARLAAEEKNLSSAAEKQRRVATENLISDAIDEGNSLVKDWFKRDDADAYKHEANIWVNKTGHLIADAYGKGQVAVFLSDAGIISYVDPRKPITETHSEIINRLQRLNELESRIDTIPIQSTFDPDNYHWVTQCDGC